MTIKTDQHFAGLVIHGLSDPGSSGTSLPVIFTDGQFVLPTSLSSAGFIARAWLLGVSGEAVTADIREPASAGEGRVVCRLDDRDGLLSKLILPDPLAPIWDLETAAVTPATATIRISGATPPEDGQVLWLEGEAVTVGSPATAVSDTVFDVDITRGSCGSFAASHRILPNLFWTPGSDGSQERGIVSSKPRFSSDRFLATVYLFREVQGAPVEIVRELRGYVAERPLPRAGAEYEIAISPVSRLVEEHTFGPNRPAVPLTRCVQVVALSGVYSQQAGGGGPFAREAALWLTGPEAALLFNEPATQPGSAGTDAALAAALVSKYSPTAERQWVIFLEAAGTTWSYEISSLSAVLIGSTTLFGITSGARYIRVGLSILKAPRGAKITGAESTVAVPAGPGLAGAVFTQTVTVYNNGFAEPAAWPLAPGEPAPKATLGLILHTTAPRFYAYLCCSDGADSGGAYDVFPGRMGLGLPEAWLNFGTAAVDPSTVTKETTELLKLEQLLPKVYRIPVKLDGKGAEILSNLCRLHLLLPTPLAAGPLTLRYWARPLGSVPTPLNPEQDEINVSTTLDALRALVFTAGLDLLTFEPEGRPRFVSLRGSRQPDFKSAQAIRVYLNESALSDAAFEDGDVADCVTAFLTELQDEPGILPVKNSLDVAYQTADYLALTDELVPDPITGRGVTAKPYFCVGVNVDWETGEQLVLLLPDNINDPNRVTAGYIAPTLLVERVESILDVGSGNVQVTLIVSSVGESSFDIGVDHFEIWTDYVGPAQLRLLRPYKHNRVDEPTQDRPGWLELYCEEIVSAEKRSYSGENVLVLILSQAVWEHDGLVLADYLTAGETFVCLPDRRLVNRLGFIVEPLPEQRYDGGIGDDFDKFSPPQGAYDGHTSAIN